VKGQEVPVRLAADKPGAGKNVCCCLHPLRDYHGIVLDNATKVHPSSVEKVKIIGKNIGNPYLYFLYFPYIRLFVDSIEKV
jgi:hypothetical protein